jgi:hypothetical protein
MSKIKKYSKEDLISALKSVENNDLSNYAAAKRYKVLNTTLLYKCSGNLPKEGTPSPATIQTTEEELLLENWVIELGRAGFPVTKNQLLISVAHLVKKLNRPNMFKDGIPGNHFFPIINFNGKKNRLGPACEP